jgi:hypothetical protein
MRGIRLTYLGKGCWDLVRRVTDGRQAELTSMLDQARNTMFEFGEFLNC